MKNGIKIKTGFGLLFISGLILCNPVVGFVDVLPNCLAYWLLCMSLYRLADLNGRIFEAVRRFRILSVLSVLQLFLSYFAYGVIRSQATNTYELRSFVMMGAFVMMLVQWFILLPAFRNLFSGLEYLAERLSVSSLIDLKKGKNRMQRMASLTRLFLVTASILSFLPELSGFSSLDGQGANGTPGFGDLWYSDVLTSPSQTVDRYSYIGVLRLLCALATVLLAVVWIVRLVSFLRCLRKETAWIEHLETRYEEEILPQIGMLTVRKFSRSFYLLQFAIGFAATLRINHYSALPGAVLALLAFLAILLLGPLGPRAFTRRLCYGACALLTGISGLELFLNASYLRRFEPEASLYNGKAYDQFLLIRFLGASEAIATLLLIALLLYSLYRIACVHTGVEYGDLHAESLSQMASKRLHRKFATRFQLPFAFFTVACLLAAVESLWRLQLDWLWLISLALSFVAIMLFYSALYELKSEICFRYESDGTNKNI